MDIGCEQYDAVIDLNFNLFVANYNFKKSGHRISCKAYKISAKQSNLFLKTLK